MISGIAGPVIKAIGIIKNKIENKVTSVEFDLLNTACLNG